MKKILLLMKKSLTTGGGQNRKKHTDFLRREARRLRHQRDARIDGV
jgi:hypothetical protein